MVTGWHISAGWCRIEIIQGIYRQASEGRCIMDGNILYYGDNLNILREHIKAESVDLIYLDPPFNSKATYNVLYKEPSGKYSEAQATAFEDTWHWGEKAASTFNEIIFGDVATANVKAMMKAFKDFIGFNDMMAYLTMMCIRLIEL